MTYNVFGGTLNPAQLNSTPSCALLGGFAINAQVSLLWQHMCLMRNVSKDASTRCMAGYRFVLWLFFALKTSKPVLSESLYMHDILYSVCSVYCCSRVQQLLAEWLWTVDTQKSQQTITNVVAKRAIGLCVMLFAILLSCK